MAVLHAGKYVVSILSLLYPKFDCNAPNWSAYDTRFFSLIKVLYKT